MMAATTLRPETSAVLRYLKDHPGATAREIADFASVSPDAVTRRLNTLYCKGLVGRSRTLGTVLPWHYFPAGVR